MESIKSLWKNIASDVHRPPEKDSKVVVVDTIMHELEYHIKELERVAYEKEVDDRRRHTGVDYSWLISTGPKGFEIPQLQRLELEEICYKIKPEECGRILSLFRDALFNDPLPSHLPQIMRSCIIQVIEQRPREETLSEWVTKRTLSLTRIRPNPKVSPSQLGESEIAGHEETRRCHSTPALQAARVQEFKQGIESLPV
ncbi:protein RD3-like [Ostrea edulis]|uniref:protein RD3-like n=1 Tax=Ostrea edulis TaxID=37623 RepID=UPI0020941266|nr:protein RD3-like [Ostrea edulis]XP_048741576.1 protein RD3-like [Ostrea edulis]